MRIHKVISISIACILAATVAAILYFTSCPKNEIVNGGVFIATAFLALIAYIQLQALREQANADFILKFNREFFASKTNQKMIEAIEENKSILKKNDGPFSVYELDDYLSYYELMSRFEKNQMLDFDLIDDMFGPYISKAWRNAEIGAYVKALRTKARDPRYYEHFEDIAGKVIKKENKARDSINRTPIKPGAGYDRVNVGNRTMEIQTRMNTAFSNYVALLDLLMADGEFLFNMKQTDAPQWQRMFIRTSVALIEGCSHCFRDIVSIGVEYDESLFEGNERRVLCAEERMKTTDRIKLTLRAIYQLLQISPLPDFGNTNWCNATFAIEKRHALMHPKTVDDLEISMESWEKIYSGLEWLIGQHFNVMNSFHERHIEKNS